MINKFVEVNVVEKRYEMLMITLLISLNILINTYRFRSLFFEKKISRHLDFKTFLGCDKSGTCVTLHCCNTIRFGFDNRFLSTEIYC